MAKPKVNDHIDVWAREYMKQLAALHNVRMEDLRDRFGEPGSNVPAIRVIASARAILTHMSELHGIEIIEHPISGDIQLAELT